MHIPSIISGSLPHPQGPYPVGYFTLTHAPLPGQGFVLSSPTIDTNLAANAKAYGSHSAPHNDSAWKHGHVPALGLRRVEYSVWYPCEPHKGWFGRDASPGGVGWLPSPVNDVLEGYARFTNESSWLRAAFPLLRVLGGRLSIPVHPAAKPLESVTPSPTSKTPQKPPLIIFSHGLAGTHLTYSHVCRALASQGNIVLSISHQDGSGPVATIPADDASCGLWAERAGGVVRSRKQDGPVKGNDGKGKGVGEIISRSDAPAQKEPSAPFKLSYLRHNDLDWSPDPRPDVMTLRSLQLDIRVHELYATYRSFETLVTKGAAALPGLVMSAGSGPVPKEEAFPFLDTYFGAERVDVDTVDLVGHSFGGGTVIWALERSIPEGEEKLPVNKAVALDPWVEPLPMPAPVKGKKDAPDVPLFVINSPRFTLWSTHFTRLNRLIRACHGTLVTLIGARHESFSDFPLLLTPGPAYNIMTTIDSLVLAFLRGDVREHDKVKGKEEDRGVLKTTTKDGRGKEGGKQDLAGEWGDVVVHEVGRT